MNCLQEWPEPIVRVQSLSDSGLMAIPTNYVKLPSQRPEPSSCIDGDTTTIYIPVIDIEGLLDPTRRVTTMRRISEACKEWGFFQVVNHGVSRELMEKGREVWREFFHLPMEDKERYANSPRTYEGYGSRVGVDKGGILDWSDYFFLHYLPCEIKDHTKWPDQPQYHRHVMDEYLGEMEKLCGRLMKILSLSLGLHEDHLQEAFGGEGKCGVCLRVNFYPRCPQPQLTLGLSPHSDPGGMTLLLPDPNVTGLQVRKDGKWVTVKATPHAFIVNIGDQIQVLSNAIYKSVEHRVIVNPSMERVTLALFYNPKADLPIAPLEELVTPETPALYKLPMTFNEYRQYIRMRGPSGKSQVESLERLNIVHDR